MRLLRQLVAWWRGTATPADRAEAADAAERLQATRAQTAFDAVSTRKQGM
jgi:hypothetical protein